MWLWILIGLSIITKVHGFSSSNFPQSCESLLPQHKRRGVDIPPQSGVPPFYIEVEEIIHGQPLTVYLKSGTINFRGFMLEARKKNMVGKSCPVGKFILLDPRETQFQPCTLTGCQNSEAVIQTNNFGKNVIKVNWTAQGEEEVDTITFRATFLQTFSKFWKPVEKNASLILPTTSPPPTTQSSTTATVTSTSTTVTSTKNSSSTTPTPTKHPVCTTEACTTAPSTTNPSSTTSTTVPSATSTSKPGTTVPSTTNTAKENTTTSTSVPSTTSTAKSSTAEWSMTNLSRNTKLLIIVVTLMAIDIFIDSVKQESHTVYKATRTDNHFSRCGIKASKILCCALCAAFEISDLVLLSKDDCVRVTLTALVCVALVINIIDLVINCLPIEPSHELKDIFDYADQVCSVIHMIFSFAVVFVGVLEIEDLRKKRKESWLVKVVIAYTVWIFLSVIRTFVFSVYENAILGTNNTGASERCRRKKKLNAGQVSVIAVSVILFVGTLCFTVAVIVRVYEKQEK